MCNASIGDKLFQKLSASHCPQLLNLSRKSVHDLASSTIAIILDMLAKGLLVNLAGELELVGIRSCTVKRMVRQRLVGHWKKVNNKHSSFDFSKAIQVKPTRKFGWRAYNAFRQQVLFARQRARKQSQGLQ